MSHHATPDYWTQQAKRQGYPARSVFKLEEIQKKWHIMKRGRPVLDVGASPGSWSLFASRTLGADTRVCAVDLQPLSPTVSRHNAILFFQGDVFSQEAADFLATHGPFFCILSDAAPSTSGNRLVDSRKSFNLVMRVMDLAESQLTPSGNMVVKVFQGGDEAEIRDRMQKMFDKVRIFRPKAVRQASMETYMIGQGFLGQDEG